MTETAKRAGFFGGKGIEGGGCLENCEGGKGIERGRRVIASLVHSWGSCSSVRRMTKTLFTINESPLSACSMTSFKLSSSSACSSSMDPYFSSS